MFTILLGLPVCLVRLWLARGLFRGDGFVREIEDLIRRSRLVRDFVADLPRDRLVTFGDIMAHADPRRVMPFFLIVTDVQAANMRTISCVWPGQTEFPFRPGANAGGAMPGRTPEMAGDLLDDGRIISAVAPRDADVPVALAVRASAGFPLFFTPAALCDPSLSGPPAARGDARQDCYVDGGVVSNFPSWVFAAGYRRSLLESGYPAFADLAFTPWVHYGLRLPGPEAGDADTALAFLRRLGGLLTGDARSRLEIKLAETVSRRRDVEPTRPAAGTAPDGVLDFAFLAQRAKVEAAFARGRGDGQRAYRPSDYALPAVCRLAPILAALAEEAEFLLAPYLFSGGRVRITIFVSEGDELVLRYHHGFASDDADIGKRLKFDQGITGCAFRNRKVVLANIRDHKLGLELRGGSDPFLKRDGAPQRRSDRTWLLSLPVIDPTASWPAPPDLAEAPLALEYIGPIFGILNVDAPLDYASPGAPAADPRLGEYHPAVRAVANAMKLAAVRVAWYFGKSKEGDDDE